MWNNDRHLVHKTIFVRFSLDGLIDYILQRQKTKFVCDEIYELVDPIK